MLNLSEHIVLKEREVNADDYRYTIRFTPQSPSCPRCGSTTLYRYGKTVQLFLDLPEKAGKRVGVEVIRQVYRCKQCKRKFQEDLPDMDEHYQTTKKLVAYIEKASLSRTFVSIADEVGLAEGTIRNIFHAYTERLERTVQLETPEILGIDEIRLKKGTFYTVISNLGAKHEIVDMLPDRDKETVKSYLRELLGREKIRIVCMDMNWLGFREAVEEELPMAHIIVDKFHFVRMANEAFEVVLNDIRRTLPYKKRPVLVGMKPLLLKRKHRLSKDEFMLLETCFESVPLLERAYNLKNDFCDVYDSQDRAQAIERCKQLQHKVPTEIRPAFDPLLKAVQYWNEQILSYMDEHVTNAYAESLNSLIRLLNNTGRGYSFKVLRAKMLYKVGRHEPYRQPYQRKIR